MPRGGRRYRNRPKAPKSLNKFHTQLSERFNYLTLCNDVSLYSGMITNNSSEGCTLLFIIPEVKEIFKTGSTFSFNSNVIRGPYFGNILQKSYVIMGMHNNVAFAIGFALMSESTKSAFKELYYKILSIEPKWEPKTIICGYNTEEADAIKEVFPNTNIQGCWFYYCRSLWKQLDTLGLGFFCNTNRIAYEHMHMWIGLPLLPFQYTVNGFVGMKANLIGLLQPVLCSEYCRKFNLFFNMFKDMWFEGVKGEMLSVRDPDVLRSNIEIELCSQHLQANMENHTNPAPWPFIRNLIAYSNFVIINYHKSNDGYYEDLKHPRATWIKRVETYKRSLRDLYAGRSNILQYLVDVMCITPGFESPIINRGDTTLSAAWHLVNVANDNDDDNTDSDDDIASLMFIESDSSNYEDASSDEEIPDELPPLVPYQYNELDFEPLIEDMCCICLTAFPQIIASPCMHQCMCTSCYEHSKNVAPLRHRSHYHCALCRRQIDFYISLN